MSGMPGSWMHSAAPFRSGTSIAWPSATRPVPLIASDSVGWGAMPSATIGRLACCGSISPSRLSRPASWHARSRPAGTAQSRCHCRTAHVHAAPVRRLCGVNLPGSPGRAPAAASRAPVVQSGRARSDRIAFPPSPIRVALVPLPCCGCPPGCQEIRPGARRSGRGARGCRCVRAASGCRACPLRRVSRSGPRLVPAGCRRCRPRWRRQWLARPGMPTLAAQSLSTRAAPSDRAGLIEAPLTGAAHKPASAM